ncbi:hypothetical protein NliqN6_4438 [Naganishia liquefaciens]|uniref:Uncharacterized protein n=1 Tax=Naganishia liquefaciens TaxID=104408 RepID=A0A8H3TUZ3_9TREE|nr:hypothetical protein NliqN6_4438 [Naganishia liquefaciens]
MPSGEPAVPAPRPIEPMAMQDPLKAQAELVANREERITIQLKPEPPVPVTAQPPAPSVAPPKLLASSPVTMPQSSPATPFEKPTASPAKIGSSPMDRGSATPGPSAQEEKQETDRKPSSITLPPPSNLRSRALSSANLPTPAARTPHPPPPPHMLRQASSYSRMPAWKEYPPPAEVRYRDRPVPADGLDALQALGAVLPGEVYRSMADRDTTRIAGEWERQLMKLQHERALLTHTFQTIASNLRVKKFELYNALDEVWVAERKIEAAGMSMETLTFSPKPE